MSLLEVPFISCTAALDLRLKNQQNIVLTAWLRFSQCMRNPEIARRSSLLRCRRS